MDSGSMIINGYRGNKLYLNILGSVASASHKEKDIEDVGLEDYVEVALGSEKANRSPQTQNITFLTEWLKKYNDALRKSLNAPKPTEPIEGVPPTLDEVLKAGYSPTAAAGIVALEQELFNQGIIPYGTKDPSKFVPPTPTVKEPTKDEIDAQLQSIQTASETSSENENGQSGSTGLSPSE